MLSNQSHISSIRNEDSVESLERTLKIQNSQRSRIIINEKSAQDVYKSTENRIGHNEKEIVQPFLRNLI